MANFKAPRSPNAAALQNILGADNVLREPQSENEALLQMIAEQTQTLINTLNEVKKAVDILSSIQRYIGVTTTELSTGATVNPILINDKSVTVVNGDAVLYNGEDFVFNGEIWQSVPDALGALAYKSSASGNYTPQGTVSQPNFTGSETAVNINKTTANISSITSVGTLPAMNYDSNTEAITFSAGTLPTTDDVTVLADVSGTTIAEGAISQPTFTGTAATITVE